MLNIKIWGLLQHAFKLVNVLSTHPFNVTLTCVSVCTFWRLRTHDLGVTIASCSTDCTTGKSKPTHTHTRLLSLYLAAASGLQAYSRWKIPPPTVSVMVFFLEFVKRFVFSRMIKSLSVYFFWDAVTHPPTICSLPNPFKSDALCSSSRSTTLNGGREYDPFQSDCFSGWGRQKGWETNHKRSYWLLWNERVHSVARKIMMILHCL